MKVAISICIIFVVINSVYNEDSGDTGALLSRERRNASPANTKDSKISSKKQSKKQRKLRRKNKSKGNQKTKSVSRQKKTKINRKENAKTKKKAKRNNRKGNKRKGKKMKRNKRKGKKMKRNNRKEKKKSRKYRNGKKLNRKNDARKSPKINKINTTNSSSTIPNKLNCDPPNTKAENNFKQNHRFYKKYNLLENKLNMISVFKGFASLLGKMTNNGTTCSEAAKKGYLLMNGCE